LIHSGAALEEALDKKTPREMYELATQMYSFSRFITQAHSTMYYNLCRIHKTPAVTLALAIGIADSAFDLDFIVELIDERAPASKKRSPYKKRNSI